tara:strand:- start:264 stop:665 length:402 start_codon:yes stop_codon:yes gene_type:complete
MKACIPTSISLIGGLAFHFCLFATPSMAPTVSSEPLSTESPSRICQQRSSIRVTSPRTFPTHGIDFEEFWQQRHRVKDRIDTFGGSNVRHLIAYINGCQHSDDLPRAQANFLLRANYMQLAPYFDGGIFDDAA